MKWYRSRSRQRKKMLVPVVGALGMAFLTVTASAVEKTRWTAYRSNLLNILVYVPADWTPVKTPKALAFRYENIAGASAGVGVMKAAEGVQDIETAANQEFEREGQPADWSRTSARVDGRRAVKIVGSSRNRPEVRMVHYYVETPRGIYLIQCQAAREKWEHFSPIFAAILNKLKFIQ